jgi:hypothetical protein
MHAWVVVATVTVPSAHLVVVCGITVDVVSAESVVACERALVLIPDLGQALSITACACLLHTQLLCSVVRALLTCRID